MKKLTTLLTLCALSTAQAMAGDIYVSNSGSDKAAGTKAAPVQTIQRALRIAREWRRYNDSRAEGGINIILNSGSTYTLDEPLFLRPEDSGTPTSKTIIKSSGTEKAIISGGTQVTSAMGIEAGAKHKFAVFQAPTVSGRHVTARTMWLGDKKLRLASNTKDGEMLPILEFNKDNETITIPASALTDYNIRTIADAPQLQMVVHQRWAIAILRVKDIVIKGDKAVLSFLNPESRWEFAHPWPQPVMDGERGSSSFFLCNASQFLDEDDEWFMDYKTGTITLASAPKGSAPTLPHLNRLVTIEGNSGDRVHDILFSNIAFQHSAWQRPQHKGHVTLQGGFPVIEAYKLTEHEGLPWAAGLENQAWVERPEAAISISWAQHVDFSGCSFTHLAATALDYTVGCADISITDNSFTDIGGTAIMAGSFAEGSTEVHRPYGLSTAHTHYDVPMTERLNITGNTIHDATNDDWGTVAIGCGFVRDCTISRNTVSRVNYSGICIGWGWTPDDTGMRNNRITDNIISDYARQLYDAGGIYTMSYQPNSLITGNTVSVPHEAPYATNFRAFPIYFDARTDGFTVKSNTLGTSSLLKEKYGYNTPGSEMVIEK